MPLVFSAIAPHSPLLLPAIGKDHTSLFAKTEKAMKILANHLYATRPDVLFIFSAHGQRFPHVPALHTHKTLAATFELFGDLSTKKMWRGATTFASILSGRARAEGVPMRMIAEESIPHGFSIPLFFLTAHIPELPLLPIGPAAQETAEAHAAFGSFLGRLIAERPERVAVVVGGDLSHAENSPRAPRFDRDVRRALEKKDYRHIREINEEIRSASGECLFGSLVILLGIMEEMDAAFRLLSYQRPFGVGCLTGDFLLG